MITTRDEINDCVRKLSEQYDGNHMEMYSANFFADALRISRSLASQYLNELFKDGYLIKIVTRPVLFLTKKTLEQKFSIAFLNNTFLSVEEFQKFIVEYQKHQYDFEDVIGSFGSLKETIDKLKAAVRYPPNGLPLLLYGEEGCGKQEMVHSVFKYAKGEKIIPESARFVQIDLAEIHDKQDIIHYLFGKEDDLKTFPSLLRQSENGIVCIKNIQLLDESTIRVILAFFNPEREKKKLYKLCEKTSARCILQATGNEFSLLHSNVIQEIPIVCKMPSYYERYTEEKEAYIYHFFQSESIKINRDILVSANVIRKLFCYKYTQNILGLENIIKLICANSIADTENVYKEELKVYSYHIPEMDYENQDENAIDYRDELVFINVNHYDPSQEGQQVLKLFDSLIECYERCVTVADQTPDDFIRSEKQYLAQYFEYLNFNKKYIIRKMKKIEQSLVDITNSIFLLHGVNEPVNFVSIIARSIYFAKENRLLSNGWNRNHADKVRELNTYVQQKFANEYEIIDRLDLQIHDHLGMKLDPIHKVIFTIHLSEHIKGLVQKTCLGIIVAHGYATATSIADAVNTMLEKYIFDAIDMPLDTTTDEIVEKIRQYMTRTACKKDVLVMVDMGSLKDIGEKLISTTQCDIGVINNVSTSMVLEAGNMIAQNQPLEQILETTSLNSIASYKLIRNKHVTPSIIFTSENGANTARRISDLFVRSLPRSIDVEILAFDYFELLEYLKNERIMQEKHLLFIFGVSNHSIEGINFVSLEDIVSMEGVDQIYQDLKVYLTSSEIAELKKNLLKNFSLENVMKNLTILEPNRLINSVSESIDFLQNLLNVRFSNHIVMGLHIHICCLIERLVTKETLDYGDLEDFEVSHSEFIEKVNKSMKNIFKAYGVDLPLSEISYLYDYISLDVSKKISR